MSSHAATKIDQKEYLKKYLSGDKVKKKKKDKKHKKEFGAAKVKIIDDDVAYNQTQEEFDEELILGGEDAPQIVGEYIEEVSSAANAPKWRSIVVKDEPVEENVSNFNSKPQEDLWGPKQIKRKIKDEFSPPRRDKNIDLHQSTPDNSPQRRKDSDKASRKHRRNNTSPDESGSRRKRHSPHCRIDKDRRYSSDQSPPRKTENISKQAHRSRNQRTPDNSPPRRCNRNDDQSPQRRRKGTPDKSPPRRRKSTPDISPQRRRKGTPDKSPPRRDNRIKETFNGRQHSDQSHKRNNFSVGYRPNSRRSRSPQKVSSKGKYGSPYREINRSNRKHVDRSSSSDQSPPRKETKKLTKSRKSRSRSVDLSPQRRNKRNSSSDQSPPRRKDLQKSRKRSISPTKRNGRNSSDQSPPRRYDGKRQKSFSPPRIKREKVSPKQSPSRVRQVAVKKERSSSPPQKHSRWSKIEQRASESPPPTHKPKATKTLDGKKAGLQDAKALTHETEERRRREERMYNEMSKEVSGRDAEVRVRSTGRKGQRARDAEAEDPEVRRRKEEHERKKKEKYDRWGKGLKQVEEYRQRTEAENYEGSKPLARYENDKDLDNFLRDQERAEDPMLEYMRKKKKERQKEEGSLAEIPKYKGSYPENRFGIRPGYRWDGVDRSNGFEKKWFDVQNEKRALQVEAYLYSVEDM
ncbi:BUD13 homolog [Bactrocera dorsalis]|uniref:BUD13 homolog n=1 Tax=Bactrocera dorsalis TaxID=27457 RepID=A0A6I9V4S2_BACDO|nr:BUD13 homolog [Bactrocera dorsalis]